MNGGSLAILGGTPVRERAWPKWPRAERSTLAAVQEVLDSSRWALSGPYDGRVCFERRFAGAFADFNGTAFCTPTTSGTAALTIALQALGVGRGDEVLVPGLTWVACASAVANIGAVPVLVDIDPGTLAMSPERAAQACSDRTRAIIVVHPFCTVADLDAFTALSERTGIPLVEDCAQAHGARWRGARVGTYGAIGTFSMQQSKLLTAGEGGAAITGDARLYELMEQLRCDGRLFVSDPVVGGLELREEASVQGRNFCMPELLAAVLLDRLGHLDRENEVRADRARCLEELLEDVEGVSALPADPRVTSRTFYNMVLRIDPGAFAGNTVDAVSRALSAELGTLVNPVYVPLNRHRLLCPARIARGDLTDAEAARLDPGRFTLPEADRARRTCLTLVQPVFLDDKEGMHDIVAAIRKVRDGARDLLATAQEASSKAF